MNYQLAMVRLTVASLGIRHAAGFVRPAAVSRWGAASASSPVLSRLASTAAPESTSSPEETAAAMVAKLCIDHPNNNVPTHIAELVGRDLHLQPNHPIGIVRKKIQDYFTTLDTKFEIFNGEVIDQI
jgi:phenylalanyl-tRNA synthetase alpha chain